MNFEELETRLMRVMRDADIRTIVSIISREPVTAVEFLVDEFKSRGVLLVANINGNCLTSSSEQSVTDSGFVVDTTLPGRVWYKEFEWPVRSTDLRVVAHTMVRALIDSGVTDPGLMTYRAWREPEKLPESWTPEEWEMFDHGENPLSIPALGLTAEPS